MALDADDAKGADELDMDVDGDAKEVIVALAAAALDDGDDGTFAVEALAAALVDDGEGVAFVFEALAAALVDDDGGVALVFEALAAAAVDDGEVAVAAAEVDDRPEADDDLGDDDLEEELPPALGALDELPAAELPLFPELRTVILLFSPSAAGSFLSDVSFWDEFLTWDELPDESVLFSIRLIHTCSS
jgi:hypothetical protein